ncbi:TPA: mechanosensitive channel protein [Escherichia coli]|nr:mechanosensitive channel protein [Escherichia coli]
MRWILFILFCLLGAPAHAVSIPGVTTTTTTDSTTEPAPEPDIEQKKAAYGALADVLDNDTSRKELIDQLRTVAATPPAEPVPKIVPPTLVEEQTVLQKVTEVSRHYGEALSARFGQLYRNITGSPHKPFNPQTFSNALTHFSMLAVLVFGFYWLIRLCALPLYCKMGQWARQKNRERSNWLQLPAMIIGAFIIDLLLLALTLFVGQVLSDNLNAGSRTIAFQQSLFLNAFALIEFFKTVLRLIFCPNVAELRPFTIHDETARYWSRRLSWLSSLIGYGLIVAVPIISNQVNVQIGALANVIIMLCMTVWALYLIFRNKKEITQHLLNFAEHSLAFFSLFIRAFALVWHWLASDIHGRPLPSARTRTLLTLFRNALAVIISTITIMIVLSEIGVNIAPLLAGAGALGLAISFGSQTLVKDIITGVFIQFENGMNTGDLVTIGPLTGTVERMSIRSVGVRQDTGAYHIIPWSSITTFANFVRGIGSVVANYDVDRHEDADKANQALKDAVAELMENEEIRGLVIGEPNFAGIVGLSNTAFTLRVSFTTLPLKQWTVRFALDSQVKKHFDLAGVRAPVQTYQVLPAPGAAPAEPLPPGEPTL